MGALFALASALLYGLVDFAGGRLARRVDGFTLALPVQCAGFLCMLMLAVAVGGTPAWPALCWGLLSGVGSGIAIMFLYRAMGCGKISLVVPLTAVVGAALPVVLALLLGERPGPWVLAGLAAVPLAVALIVRGPVAATATAGPTGTAGRNAFYAGLGVALQYAAIAHAPESGGMWPMAANRLASVGVVWAGVHAAGVASWPPRRHVGTAAWLGLLASLSLALYLLSTRLMPLSVAVVLASLYPLVPVLLGLMVLRERLSAQQWSGVAVAMVAICLIVSH